LEGVDRLTPTLSDVGFVNVFVGGTVVDGPLRPPDGGVVFTLQWEDGAGEVPLGVVDPVLLLLC
jgi:hypothetical protein